MTYRIVPFQMTLSNFILPNILQLASPFECDIFQGHFTYCKRFDTVVQQLTKFQLPTQSVVRQVSL